MICICMSENEASLDVQCHRRWGAQGDEALFRSNGGARIPRLLWSASRRS